MNQANEDEQFLEDNREYILGLYDLYNNDQDVEKMLVQKGLGYNQIQLVLATTNRQRKEKRLRQARRFLLISLGIAVILWTCYFLLKNLPGADTMDAGPDMKEEMLYRYFLIYRKAFYFVLAAVSIQVFTAIVLFVKRSVEWRHFIRSVGNSH